ncbi:MAG: hypothetical protein ACK4VW_07885 [Anaerolineales bacterium]
MLTWWLSAPPAPESLLAERLARLSSLDLIELNALPWRPGWRPALLDEFCMLVESSRMHMMGGYGKLLYRPCAASVAHRLCAFQASLRDGSLAERAGKFRSASVRNSSA